MQKIRISDLLSQLRNHIVATSDCLDTCAATTINNAIASDRQPAMTQA
jgi:hypothetical protein